MKALEETGYLVLATNTDSVDYVNCAERLAKSLKKFHPQAKICLVTDQPISNTIFDYVKQIESTTNPFANDWKIFSLSPFRETIKLEVDMLVASPIDHWWTMFRHRDIVISTGCRDWLDNVSTSRKYRKLFDENNLPDVYNAVTYWRLSQTAQDFFNIVQSIFDNWSAYKILLKFPEDIPSTDVVYAMAAQILGPEKCTLPFSSYPKIVHMKEHIIGTSSNDWTKELVWEHNPLRIQTVAQWGLFHYNKKDWQ